MFFRSFKKKQTKLILSSTARKRAKKRANKRRAKLELAKLGGDGHNPDAGFFEGAEKLFEVWFDSSTDKYTSLRSIPRQKIDHLLTFVKCTVISVMKGDQFDAYLLSESSLFVFDDFIILKTCGTTTLLHFVPRFLALAAETCNASTLLGLWYSRKNMFRPELQIGMHQSFTEEMSFLDKELDKLGGMSGGAYMLGRLNGDHWNLYAMDPPEWDSSVELTFELLMSDLDQERMKELFYCSSPDAEEQKRLGKECTDKSGIGALLEGVSIDESMFYPCGYSMNGQRGRQYYTIHVTPQPECSYASFETNFAYDDYDEVVRQLIAVFRPGRFIVNICSQNAVPNVSRSVEGFVRRDWVEYEIGQSTMHMGHYVQVAKYARTPSTLDLLAGNFSTDSDPEQLSADGEK